MCYADDSRAPAPPRSGAVADAGDAHLRSADGARFMAYRARPERPSGQGAVILPDFRGLHGFYTSFARRLAEAGIAATAVDYYGRDLPDGPRDASMETMVPHLMRLTPEQVAADVAAATEALRVDGVEATFVIGFCYGGSQAWNQSAFDHGLAGCVGFYGRPDDCRPLIPDMRVPLLLLAAGEDALTPVADSDAFDAELTEAGVDHERMVYPGAPHGFFDAMAADHADACADAWRRLLGFVDEHADRVAGSAS